MIKISLKDKILELLSLFTIAIGTIVGTSDSADASHDLYYGDNHGGNVSHPPEGSVVSDELSAKTGYPTAVDETNETYYMYVISHWFDPQQMAEFPVEIWMYGVAPYDHSSEPGGSSGDSGNGHVE